MLLGDIDIGDIVSEKYYCWGNIDYLLQVIVWSHFQDDAKAWKSTFMYCIRRSKPGGHLR